VIEYTINDPFFKAIINEYKLARLATVDSECMPYLIPVVFVFDNDSGSFFLPIDEKTKRSRPESLKRVKNIQQNPNVALLIDKYNEDWRKLFFIMIRGRASIIGGNRLESNGPSLSQKAHKLLYHKYPQYQKIGIGEYIIMIITQKIITWNMKN
jgi:coenzyme F420-0:L-glutamate ligase/coenzyme F420-1:gamma-L-glutamate ligase